MDNQYKPMKPEKYMEDLNKFLIEKRKVTLPPALALALNLHKP